MRELSISVEGWAIIAGRFGMLFMPSREWNRIWAPCWLDTSMDSLLVREVSSSWDALEFG